MASWELRLEEAFGPRGYEDCMRRSLQTVVLYEANRCCSAVLPSLRPFQRKIAYHDMTTAIVSSLKCLQPHQKEQVLWRTATSRETLDDENCWKRRKLISKELEKINMAIVPLLDGRTNEEAIQHYLLNEYQSLTGTQNKQPPRNWEHQHNNVLLCYKLYYRNGVVDPDFPQPQPPKPIFVLLERPKAKTNNGSIVNTVHNPSKIHRGGRTSMGADAATTTTATAPLITHEAPPTTVTHTGALGHHSTAAPMGPPPLSLDATTVAAGSSEVELTTASLASDTSHLVSTTISNQDDEQRRRILQEVRDHLDLLKQFEGVISPEELAKRKRELFMALPPAPPPAISNKKLKTTNLAHV